ncbi:MAG TPA: peptidylprolyl isomerase [Kofleriaceae bacterium]|nr:peptidylprolyl isomerase [Kofleriaceae bacterium]
MKRILIIVSLAALAAAGCQKEKKKGGPETQGKTGEATDKATPPAGGETPGGSEAPADVVRPPTAADLAAYTGDLQGTGPLTAAFETTQGTIHCELFEQGAPVTVANFVGLARGLHAFKDPVSGKIEKRPFYDGTVFHRVIPGFMVQGGDPTATGEGGPGYEFATEVSKELKHGPGTLSMANAGPNTNGSQFFITEVATPKLDGGYNVFGTCKELDVVKKLAAVDKVAQSNGEKSRPSNTDEVALVKVTISRGTPDGDAQGGDKKDDKKGKDKKEVKKQDKPSEQPKSSGEPDHHDHK